MEQDPTRICELLVGLGDVDVVGVVDEAIRSVGGACADTARGRCVRVAAGWCVPRTSARCGWWICRRSAIRCGWCGTSIAGSARPQIVRRVRSPRSQRGDRTDAFGVDDPCGALGDDSGGS